MHMCCRSVFGGTVGPNPAKPSSTETQYYEGIKVRAQPLVISIQTTNPVTGTTVQTPLTKSPAGVVKSSVVKRKPVQKYMALAPAPITTTPGALTVIADNSSDPTPASPASPILKAQLSAPPKPRETTVIASAVSKSDTKSQVIVCCKFHQSLVVARPSLFTLRGRTFFIYLFWNARCWLLGTGL